MSCHIVSDDYFFLAGFREYPVFSTRYFYYHQALNGQPELLPGERVIIAIENARLRQSFMNRHQNVLKLCRLIILQDFFTVPGNSGKRSSFPWVLPKRISHLRLEAILSQAQQAPVVYRKTGRDTLMLFERLSLGHTTVKGIAGNSKTSIQKISRIKQDVLRDFGLMKCNSVGVLLCRDILQLNR